MDERTERRLIERAKDGDSKAFETLMESSQDKVFRLAYRVTGCHDGAENVTQDVFLQAYRSLPRFRNDCRFSTWLHVITMRKAIDWCRDSTAERRTLHISDWSNPGVKNPKPGVDPVQIAQKQELEETLNEAIATLPPNQRAALALVVQEGHSYKDAADMLNCSVGTVAWRVWNARRLLKDMLESYLRP